MSIGQWQQKAVTTVDAVEGRVCGYVCRMKVHLDFKKSNLKPMTNLATNTVEEAKCLAEKETGAEVEP